MTRFLSDILLPFPNLNDLNSHGKIVIFRGFSKIFSELYSKRNQSQCGLRAIFGPNYVQCCEKSKETGNIIRFFSYFTWDYLIKQEAVVLKPPKWKFIAIIGKNTKFKGC